MKDFSKAQDIQPTAQITEYQKKVAEKMDKLKLEMIEKMKRKGAAVLNEGDRSTLELLVRIPVGEINPPPAPLGGVKEPAPAKTTSEKPAKQPAPSSLKSALTSKEEEPAKKDKKKKKKKAKGIDAFMEDDEEAKAFQELNVEEKKSPERKPRKSVGFNLEQNQVKEFDKTKKILEVSEEEPIDAPTKGKKSISQENMDDMVNRAIKSKRPTEDDIVKLSKSDTITKAHISSV